MMSGKIKMVRFGVNKVKIVLNPVFVLGSFL